MGNGFVHLRAVAVKKAATGARSSGGKNHGARSCVWRRNAHLAVVSFASWHVLPFDAATHLSSPLLPQRRLLLCYECRADHCTVIPTIAPERSVRQALSFSICTSRVLLTYSTTFSFAHVQHEQVGKRESCVVGCTRRCWVRNSPGRADKCTHHLQRIQPSPRNVQLPSFGTKVVSLTLLKV